MTISELKEYIFNEQKIEYILNELGCHEIRYNEQRATYSACQPDGDNPQGVNIRNNEYLNYRSFSRGIDYEDGQDLISLVETVKKLPFVDTIKYLHKILGLEYKWEKNKKTEKKFDPLAVFKNAIRSSRRVVNVDDIQTLKEDLLQDYIPMLHIDWLKEGITERARKKFGICYSYRNKRIMIPLRYWLDGSLLGFNGRTTIENYSEFGVSKYWITPTYPKSLNLYGLYENYESIQKAGYVTIFESEKSVHKRSSLMDDTGVALQGHSMSDEQTRILIGLNVDIILALDSDINKMEIYHIAEKFYNIRNVYIIEDRWGLIPEKSCMADCRNKVAEFLIKHKKKYGKAEHEQYLKELKNR